MALRHGSLSPAFSRGLCAVTRGDRERQPISGHGMVGTVSGSRRLKRPLKEALLGNLDRLNTNRLWEAFHLPVFRVSAQIDSFYARYAIAG